MNLYETVKDLINSHNTLIKRVDKLEQHNKQTLGYTYKYVHIHNWKPANPSWDYKMWPMPSYVVVCDCGASALAVTETHIKEITNVRETQ